MMPNSPDRSTKRSPTERDLALSPDSRPLRRALGPTAWTVLEEIAFDATTDDAGLVAVSTNVRDLAEQLGLVKDTVAGAVNRLIVSGIVVRRPQDQHAGRFDAVVYELRLPAGLTISPCPDKPDTARSPVVGATLGTPPCPNNADTAVVPRRVARARLPRALRERVEAGDQLRLLDVDELATVTGRHGDGDRTR